MKLIEIKQLSTTTLILLYESGVNSPNGDNVLRNVEFVTWSKMLFQFRLQILPQLEETRPLQQPNLQQIHVS